MSSFDTFDRELSRQVRKAPYLTPQQELDLLKAWVEHKDRKALDAILASHGRLVMRQAVRMRHYGVSIDDLYQEGQIGLMKAMEKFDLAFNVRFATAAGWWVRAALQDYVLRNVSLVRSIRSQDRRSLFFKARAVCAKITAQNPDLSPREVYERAAKELNSNPGEIEAIVYGSSGEVSLNVRVGEEEDGSERGDLIADPGARPDEIVEGIVDGERQEDLIKRAIAELDPRSQHIIRSRFMADDEDTKTLEELAEEYGITRERIRQIQEKALGKLKGTILRLRRAGRASAASDIPAQVIESRSESLAQPPAGQPVILSAVGVLAGAGQGGRRGRPPLAKAA